MSSDEAARHTGRFQAIKNPEQVQQAKQPDAPEPRKPPGMAGGRSGLDAPRRTGILGQLDTERAHD